MCPKNTIRGLHKYYLSVYPDIIKTNYSVAVQLRPIHSFIMVEDCAMSLRYARNNHSAVSLHTELFKIDLFS